MLPSIPVPVVVSAVVVFLDRALWYSPILFANPWMRAHGHTERSSARCRREPAARTRCPSCVIW